MATEKTERGILNGHISKSAGIRPFKMDLVYASTSAFLTAKSTSSRNSSSAEEGDWFYHSSDNAFYIYANGTWRQYGESITDIDNITFDSAAEHVIAAAGQVVSTDTAGSDINISAGRGSGTGKGGTLSLSGGIGYQRTSEMTTYAGDGGDTEITSGAPTYYGMDSGDITVSPGAPGVALAGTGGTAGTVAIEGTAGGNAFHYLEVGGTGGVGTTVSITGGDGGDQTSESYTGTSGDGADVTIQAGSTGDVALAGSSLGVAGAATLRGGAGKVPSVARASGSGGATNVYGGAGGDNPGASAAGNGGPLYLGGGAAGISDSGTSGIVGRAQLMTPHCTGTGETVTGAGAVSLETAITLINVAGVTALTLADPPVGGQHKYIMAYSIGGAATVTPSNLLGYSTITFNNAGECAHLVFYAGDWYVLSAQGCVLA